MKIFVSPVPDNNSKSLVLLPLVSLLLSCILVLDLSIKLAQDSNTLVEVVPTVKTLLCIDAFLWLLIAFVTCSFRL